MSIYYKLSLPPIHLPCYEDVSGITRRCIGLSIASGSKEPPAPPARELADLRAN
jgi:hypothetical protein